MQPGNGTWLEVRPFDPVVIVVVRMTASLSTPRLPLTITMLGWESEPGDGLAGSVPHVGTGSHLRLERSAAEQGRG